MQRVVIIGSGLGGLSCGLILSRNGYDVTVLEQGAQAGGCLQCFSRHGVRFETGMHFIGSADEGQVLNRLLRYLDVFDDISLSRLAPSGYDIISLQGHRFRLANGKEPFIETLAADFPSERDNLHRYFGLVESVASASSLHSLRMADVDASPLNTEFQLRSINDVLDEVVGDPLLRHVLVGNLPLYAAVRDKTPFSTHAFITDFYNQSAFRIVGGSDRIASSLVKSIQRYGGRVLCRQQVTHIDCDGVKAVGVETADHYYPADTVISDIHPARLIELCDSPLLRPAYRRRVQALSETVGGFSVYLRFKPETVPYMNYNFYGYRQMSPWDCEHYSAEEWPKGYLYMHFCNEERQQWAQGGVILSYMQYSEVARWQGTRVGHRGEDYEQMKRERGELLIDAVCREFPGLRDGIAGYETSTPLTYRDYTGTEGGSMYGIAKDVSLGPASRVHHRTKIPNLLLTGQNINSHGILGVLVGTVVTCSELLTSEHIFKEIVQKQSRQTAGSAVIIGGGLGGLFTGALLTKEGFRVTVLEKNPVIGGGLQTFRRGGVTFETGMHMLGGLRPGGTVHKICQYIGILDELQLLRTDADCMDSITYLKEQKTYRVPEGREAFTQYFISEFPHEEQGIRDYVGALYRLADEVDFFYLRTSNGGLYNHSEQFFWSASDLIAYYIKDVRLRDVLAYMNPMYGGMEGHTPAYIHALINVLYIGGQDRFAGGSQQLAQALARRIEQGGGAVLPNSEVVAVHVDGDRRVTSVATATGNSYIADFYISAIHPQRTVSLCDGVAFPKSYRQRIAGLPNTYSAFTVYIKLRPDSFPYINHTCYFQDEYGKVWQHGEYDPADEGWPHGFMYMTPADAGQGAFATKMIVNCLMPFSVVERWAGTTVGHRGQEYEQWKQCHVERIIGRLEQLFPGFRSMIDQLWSSSPLTIRDFYDEPGGALYGIRKDCQNMMLSQIPVVTKVRNLLLTGQNINLHGICGVPLTAVNTVEAIIGQNRLVEKINNYYDRHGEV